MRIGTPYRVFGGVRFYQRKEIKDVLAYLRLLVNPQDVISFRRVVNTPKRGIGDATVAAIESFARDRGHPDHARRPGASTRSPCSPTRAKGAVAGFNQVMDALRSPPGRRRRPRAHGGVRRAWSPATSMELEEERTVEAQGRIENLQELAGVAAELIAREPDADLERVPRAGLAGRGAGRVRRGGLHRHADDPAHREGPGVPGGVHGGDGGRHLPALPLDDRHRRARGGAPARVRGHHPRAAAAVPQHAWSRTLFGQTQYNPPSPVPAASCRSTCSSSARASGRAVRRAGRGAYPGANRGGGSVIGRPERRRAVRRSGLDAAQPRRGPQARRPGRSAPATPWSTRSGARAWWSPSSGAAATAPRPRSASSDVGEKRVLLAYAPLRKAG